MTAAKLIASTRKMDRWATLRTAEGLDVEVTILDVRQAYGRTDYFVTPHVGSRKAWVTAKRLRNLRGKLYR